jgi:hypothetical protein
MEFGTGRRAIWTAAIAWILLSASSGATAQDWAKAMFNATSFDFGTVARGAKVEHHFTIENKYEEDIQIAQVATSCRCTVPQIDKRLLKTWEKADLTVALDTRDFTGRRDTTITVRFGPPFDYAEVQLHMHAFIRSDVVVQPGSIQFGSINEGSSWKQTAAISYAGRDNWRIERVECTNPNLEASVVETRRAPADPMMNQPAYVYYNLSVMLKAGAPPGYLRDQLMLVTNDANPRSARVPVSVEGNIIAPLSVAPKQQFLGLVEAGKTVTKNIVVRGQKPFRILSTKSSDERFSCRVSPDAKNVHVIPIIFSSKDSAAVAGTVHAKLRIETDLDGLSAVEADVSAQVVVPNSAKPASPSP